MHLFLVIFDEAIASEAKERATPHVPTEGIYQLSDHVLLVRSPIDDSKYVGAFFGLDGSPNNTDQVGVIFRLNGSYYGNYYTGLWDWLKKARE